MRWPWRSPRLPLLGLAMWSRNLWELQYFTCTNNARLWLQHGFKECLRCTVVPNTYITHHRYLVFLYICYIYIYSYIFTIYICIYAHTYMNTGFVIHVLQNKPTKPSLWYKLTQQSKHPNSIITEAWQAYPVASCIFSIFPSTSCGDATRWMLLSTHDIS